MPHFRTAVLRETGGWDPYNVTEDADIGIRLARFGYRTQMIDSTTYEEAPARLAPWLRQRTRWFKGWMQTWLVHMRAPRRLMRQLGLPGFLSFQLLVGGTALAALVHPLFLAGLIANGLIGVSPLRTDSAAVATLTTLYGATAITGYLVSIFLGWRGLAQRRLLASGWVLILTPLHWLLLSLAAWRALFQLVVAPYRWEKTDHGLAKSSHRNANMARSLLELETYLRHLKQTGRLPALAGGARNISAARRRRPAATA